MNTGIDMITFERIRQKDVWGDSHDDEHDAGEIAAVAANLIDGREDEWGLLKKHPQRLRQLVIAGALIAAEIDRLLRLES